MSTASPRRRCGNGPLRTVPVTLVLVVVCALTACSPSGGGDDGPDRTTTEHLVCGLVDAALVRKVIASGEIGTRGPGVVDREARALEPANCTVQDMERYKTFLQVSIGEVDPAKWRRKLREEAKDNPDRSKRYTGDLGYGYGCTYERGVFVNGAGVYVVRGDRLIRVNVYHWADATPKERLALAEGIARNADENLTAYDKQHSD